MRATCLYTICHIKYVGSGSDECVRNMNTATPHEESISSIPTAPPTHTNMSPLEVSTNWWSSWSDSLGLIAAVLGGFLGLVALFGWGFAWKAGKLKDDLSGVKEREFDARISEANRDAAIAKKEAALANERTAIAELKLEKLRIRFDPRTIGDHAVFGSPFAAFKGIPAEVVYLKGDKECRDFAENLADSLSKYGEWKVSVYGKDADVVRESGIRIGTSPLPSSRRTPTPEAFEQWSKDHDEFFKAAAPLIAALRKKKYDAGRTAKGISFEYEFKGLLIFVGLKPDPNDAEDMKLFESHFDDTLSEQEKRVLIDRETQKRFQNLGIKPKNDEVP